MHQSGSYCMRMMSGMALLEYDQPSTTFGRFGDKRVMAVARGLDAALESALLAAAE
jgi:hypothetical protein